jgi:hypothetical protein
MTVGAGSAGEGEEREMSAEVPGEASLRRAEELLERLERTRAELERIAGADDPDAAIDVLAQLAEIAKEVEAELARARREADAGG